MNVHTLATIIVDNAASADQNWLAAAWVIYGGVALILLVTGLSDYLNMAGYGNKKAGARRALAAPVWPIVLIVLTVITLVDFAVGLWKDAK